jgi:putative phosphoribosyl transferase
MGFIDRREAGRRLAARLAPYSGDDVVVLGLPRGGVPVASEVADALGAPLDVIIVRKLGVPFQPELAMGAIGEDGARTINDEVVRIARITPGQIASVETAERHELERRARSFRGHRPRIGLSGRTALIVDDGIATGSTARAACQVARAHGAARVILAVPVAPPDAAERFADDVDEFIALETPAGFQAVGQFYGQFAQVTDDEVIDLLDRAERRPVAAHEDIRSSDVVITAGAVALEGHLELPPDPLGIVLFAHGSGSSRHSPRNQYVASVLDKAGIGTLLFDLLTVEEESDRTNVFDIELLARRLTEATDWLCTRPELSDLPVGYFGASTGAGAALWAAGDRGAHITAVVSRGGRPDLAGVRLSTVEAPTLLIVGGHDPAVLDLNREAAARMRARHEIVIIPGATHLFEEPGTLALAADSARDWFTHEFRMAATT